MASNAEILSVENFPRTILTSNQDELKLIELGLCDAADLTRLINFDRGHLKSYFDRINPDIPVNTEMIEDFIDLGLAPPIKRFGIWSENTLRGLIQLSPRSIDSAEIGYFVGKEHTGQRFASRAQRMLASFTLQRGQMATIIARIKPKNAASIRTSKLAGFHFSHLEDGFLIFSRTQEVTLPDRGTSSPPVATLLDRTA